MGKTPSKKHAEDKIGISKISSEEESPKKKYKNIEEEMLDYLSNRQQDDFHEVLGAAKYSTGNPSLQETKQANVDYNDNDSDDEFSKNKNKNKYAVESKPPKPQTMAQRNSDYNRLAEDDSDATRPAETAAAAPTTNKSRENKPKRVFGAKKKLNQGGEDA